MFSLTRKTAEATEFSSFPLNPQHFPDGCHVFLPQSPDKSPVGMSKVAEILDPKFVTEHCTSWILQLNKWTDVVIFLFVITRPLFYVHSDIDIKERRPWPSHLLIYFYLRYVNKANIKDLITLTRYISKDESFDM